MSYLVTDGDRYALPFGDTMLGGNRDEELVVPSLATLPPFAVITVWPEEATRIRRIAPELTVTVDGEPLGGEPRELQHGARIEVSGQRIVYGDIRMIGSTARGAGVADDELAAVAELQPGEATASTGGRLIALRDGTVHVVPEGGIVIGRDPSCGIVLASKDVSRRHAVVIPALLGYAVSDTSLNGVFVNGMRVRGVQVLGQGDVIRIAGDEFRFEADAASFEPAPELFTVELPASAARAAPAAAPPRATEARPTAPGAGRPTAAQPVPTAPALLATLEIMNEGVLKGTRFRIERPVAQLGRGTHNDVRISDPSVSGSHATLLQRDGRWHVLDLGSTNGTYVDGERATGEHALRGTAELRLGNIKMIFRSIAPSAANAQATRRIVGVTDE